VRAAGEPTGPFHARLEEEHAAKMKNRDAYLRRTYGITLDQYNELLASQDGHCACCPFTPKEGQLPLNVDHDHKTGFVRGLLCWKCNKHGVGQHRTGDLLRAYADYLDNPPAFAVIGQCKAPKKRKARRKSTSRQAN
jgi:hypothetical protein